ncbi:protein of unknown function DUF820 [Gloeothece citriformis PCC 7424]|uniref:Putative restriction endonuclease domain-containing protein n=1 Tax=Gloeothece citriformis (strain PCC 7424) TaxID=65393 RepID=B7KF82_GLOC7|nr:Uma2 family endonuclease [Gloeothece citriformis]ACK71798.1 protein of unknown function DUF820 [Gloeothece citriformis PCC 7424]
MSQAVTPPQNPSLEPEQEGDEFEFIEPDISDLIIEDDTPVDSWLSEKQQRLLTASAYSSLQREIPFVALANVGLFYAFKQPPLVPDVMLSLGVSVPEDWSQKKNRSYFAWNMGKLPDVAIEIVSNRVGNELGSKLEDYAKARVAYYVIFDPLRCLKGDILYVYELQGLSYHLLDNYWMEDVQLGLTLWQGLFEGTEYNWLRWCDREGNLLLTGDEKAEQERQRAEQERQRAEQERQRAERLAQLLREQGIDPDEIP